MEANNLSNIKQNKKGLGKAAFMIIGLVIGMAAYAAVIMIVRLFRRIIR